MKYLPLLVVLSIPLTACSIPRSIAEGGPMANRQVDPAGRVLILSIANGQEQSQDSAPGSGQGVVAALEKVMASHGVPLSATATSALPSGLDEAQRAGFRYVLKGTITLWEDNATVWSGNGDKLTIHLELYDARSRELVAAATHKRVATGFTFVSGTPDRFMDEVAAGALGRLYGWNQEIGTTSTRTSATDGPAIGVSPKQSPADVEAMNAELRQLAKDSLANGDPKAAKDYLDMIVPASSQH
jgi:hypothetical protein